MITVIFITGPSGCGKSTMASAVAKSLLEDERQTILAVRIFHQDDYFTMPFIPYSERHDTSYEDDSGIDFSKLKADMETCAIGFQNELKEKAKKAQTERDHPLQKNYEAVMIVEGHMIGAAAESLCHSISYEHADDDDDDVVDGAGKVQVHRHRSNADANTNTNTNTRILSILIDCSRNMCKQRRLNRRKRSNEEWEELSCYFDRAVWKGFEEYGVSAMQSLREKTITNAKTNTNTKTECQNGCVLDICTEGEESLCDNIRSVLDAFF